jgi:hypothetical protein
MEEGFILLMVSEVSVHHAGEGIVEQNCLYHCGQEVEKERKCLCWWVLFLFPLLSNLGLQAYGLVPPTFKVGLSTFN